MIPKKNTAKDLWKPRRRIEISYARSLRRVMKVLQNKLKGVRSLSDILKILKDFAKSEEFKKHAEAEARKMVTSVFTDAGKTWRTAANVNSKGRQIYEALKHEIETTPIGTTIQEQTDRNARLIKSMPEKIRTEITDYVARRSVEGRRSEDIAEELQSIFPQMIKNKANLIARTETSKTEAILTKARSENLGIKAYLWKCSMDTRTRDSHKALENVICFFNQPIVPEKIFGEKSTLHPGVAGEFPNCRCYCEPIIRIDFIKFPHKVCYNNKIVTMTKKQFEEVLEGI